MSDKKYNIFREKNDDGHGCTPARKEISHYERRNSHWTMQSSNEKPFDIVNMTKGTQNPINNRGDEE